MYHCLSHGNSSSTYVLTQTALQQVPCPRAYTVYSCLSEGNHFISDPDSIPSRHLTDVTHDLAPSYLVHGHWCPILSPLTLQGHPRTKPSSQIHCIACTISQKTNLAKDENLVMRVLKSWTCCDCHEHETGLIIIYNFISIYTEPDMNLLSFPNLENSSETMRLNTVVFIAVRTDAAFMVNHTVREYSAISG